MNASRLDRLRKNAALPAFADAVARLKRAAADASAIDYRIGREESGAWMHYYHCRQDGAGLTFDWSRPGAHRCPVCGMTESGEPYDAAWVSIAHVKIGQAIYDIAFGRLLDGEGAGQGEMQAAGREAQAGGAGEGRTKWQGAGRQEAVQDAEQSAGQGSGRAKGKEAEQDAEQSAGTAFAKRCLLAYAEHYAGYREHGGVAYNGPGKLFAQTLDEAHWILDLAVGYALLRDAFSSSEDAAVREGLLRPCAAFLIAHKESQIHNHGVLITSAIAALGLLLDDADIRRAGLEGEYGLYDQLERGIAEDGLWYEGNLHYHFYAFASLLHYALLAEGTPWDIWGLPKVRLMFDFPLRFIMPDGTLPAMNDAKPGSDIRDYAPYYEIALDRYGDESYRSLLRASYGIPPDRIEGLQAKRESVYALLYGHELPEETGRPWKASLSELASTNASYPVSGLTKLVNAGGWHVVVKHSRFGGEHDHMDRLGLSVTHGGVPLFADPGTTAYAVPAHYGWFKHTLSHNTVCLGGADQPPADGRLLRFEETTWGAWVDTSVEWGVEAGGSYAMKGLIELPADLRPWDEDAYRGAVLRRTVALAADHLLDIVRVTTPAPADILLPNHFSGTPLDEERRLYEEWLLDDEQPLDEEQPSWLFLHEGPSALESPWLREMKKLSGRDAGIRAYGMSKGVLTHLYWASVPIELYAAVSPDNPPNRDRATFIQRAEGASDVYFIQAYVYDPAAIAGEPPVGAALTAAVVDKETLRIRVHTGAGRAFDYLWDSRRSGGALTRTEG